MNQTGFKLDVGPWKEACRRYAELSSRTQAQVINRSAGSIAAKAFQWTPRANRQKIERDLFYTANSLRQRARKAVFKKVRRYTPLAYAITKKRNGRELAGEALEAATRKLVSRRMSAIGYIKHGWVPAIRALAAGTSLASEGFKVRQPYGQFAKASEGQAIKFAMVENDARAANLVGAQALQIAFDQEASQLSALVSKRMAEDSARV